MDFKFTTIEECQEKINKMKILLKEFEDLNNIQFPIEDGCEKQFRHYPIYHINCDLLGLNYDIDKLQEELNRYKKVMEDL